MALLGQDFPGSTWDHFKYPTFKGWDKNEMEDLRNYIADSTAITAVMIVHQGKSIFEYGNLSENSYIASCRKSVMAMLYGKYVANGTIKLNKTLESLQIGQVEPLLAMEKKATVKDILSSRSGVFLPASNGGDMLHLAPERGSVAPGSFWLYSNWDFNMAGYIFEQETGQNIYDEIERQLAIPLQMQDWNRSLQQKSGDKLASDVMAYHMWFSARDMARIGLLMLENGTWNGTQLIAKDWVKEMTTPKSTFEELDTIAPFLKETGAWHSYGYMWWLWEHPDNEALEGAYTANGAYGQTITVLPKSNTVLIVKTNDLYERQGVNPSEIIDRVSRIYQEEKAKAFKPMAKHLETNDVQGFIKSYAQMDKTPFDTDFQYVLNSMGYSYLNQGDYENAMAIFKLNISQYPKAWNVYDSLGEAYFFQGNYEKAAESYRKAKALLDQNDQGNAKRIAHILDRIARKN